MFPAVIGLGVLLLFALAGRKGKGRPAGAQLPPVGLQPVAGPPPPASGPLYPVATMPGGAAPPPPTTGQTIAAVQADGQAVIDRAFANCAGEVGDDGTPLESIIGYHADSFFNVITKPNVTVQQAHAAYEVLRGAITAMGCQ